MEGLRLSGGVLALLAVIPGIEHHPFAARDSRCGCVVNFGGSQKQGAQANTFLVGIFEGRWRRGTFVFGWAAITCVINSSISHRDGAAQVLLDKMLQHALPGKLSVRRAAFRQISQARTLCECIDEQALGGWGSRMMVGRGRSRQFVKEPCLAVLMTHRLGCDAIQHCD